MNVTFFYRSNAAGFSIAKVFRSLVDGMGAQIGCKEFFVPARRADPYSIIRNLLFVYKKRNRNGINHITGDIHYCVLALIGCKTVLTVHDLSMMDRISNPLKKLLIKWFWFSIPVFFADRVVCISKTTYNELLKIVPGRKVSFIHNAVDPSFQFTPKVFNDHCPSILQIGTSWNKNLVNVISALKGIKCLFTIVGQLNPELEKKLIDSSISYKVLQNLSDEEILYEYVACDVVCFCSIYEGFGMPIIEANAVGRCIVTSALEPMLEVAGGSACIVDPYSVESIREGLLKVISEETYRTMLISSGLENVKRFDVADAVNKYFNIYAAIGSAGWEEPKN
ncbi:glycosyltransferase [Pedobacter terrae]|uniref:glycosyltransferase n=1 Tax=Pedobacter terrae TaxID=405671 RepID=UPI002FF5A640